MIGKASVMSVMKMWSSLCSIQVVVVKVITCFPKAAMIADGSNAGTWLAMYQK
jgi:hypothetical protein